MTEKAPCTPQSVGPTQAELHSSPGAARPQRQQDAKLALDLQEQSLPAVLAKQHGALDLLSCGHADHYWRGLRRFWRSSSDKLRYYAALIEAAGLKSAGEDRSWLGCKGLGCYDDMCSGRKDTLQALRKERS